MLGSLGSITNIWGGLGNVSMIGNHSYHLITTFLSIYLFFFFGLSLGAWMFNYGLFTWVWLKLSQNSLGRVDCLLRFFFLCSGSFQRWKMSRFLVCGKYIGKCFLFFSSWAPCQKTTIENEWGLLRWWGGGRRWQVQREIGPLIPNVIVWRGRRVSRVCSPLSG